MRAPSKGQFLWKLLVSRDDVWVVVCCAAALSLPQITMRILKLKILTFIRKFALVTWEFSPGDEFNIYIHIYLQAAFNMHAKRLKTLQREKLKLPRNLVLCIPQIHVFVPAVTLHSAAVFLGDKIEDCSLALGRKPGAHTCILCTAMQLFIFHVVALWQFFMNKKVQWRDSPCRVHWWTLQCCRWWQKTVEGTQTSDISA